MWSSALLTTAFFALAAAACHDHTPFFLMDYYEEIGCKPAMMGDDGCPKSYDCSMIGGRAQNKCYYKGREYEQGHQLQQTDNDCLAGCRCSGGEFTCVGAECFSEVFGYPLDEGCFFTYEHGRCCSTGKVCLSDQTPEQTAAKTVCRYKSQEYQIGQQIYQEDEPCLKCICQEGFNGSLVEPYCKKISCSLELHYGRRIADGCIPVYYGENDCCPIGWRCPEKSDRVATATSVKNYSKIQNSDLQCQFGGVKMQVGDKLSASREWPNTECTCRVPPHPVCIQQVEKTRPYPVL